jgi:hypothetical protein
VGRGEQGKVLDAEYLRIKTKRQDSTVRRTVSTTRFFVPFFERHFVLLADVLIPGELEPQGVTMDCNSFHLFPQDKEQK